MDRKLFVTLNVMSTREVSPHSATIEPCLITRPFSAPRGCMGPIGVSNGSRPKVVARSTARSFVAGFSLAIANAIAASSLASSMPACAGVFFCHSKRSGK